MVKYILMHKDDACGVLTFDETDGKIISYRDNGTGKSPYMGNCDLAKIKKWWEMRAVPASRTIIQDIIKNTDCINSEIYLAKNLALSMTDSYWVCPVDFELKYDQVKFYNLVSYNNGKVPYHNATSYNPNASLGGQMEKYWDLDCELNGIPSLVKESSKFYGQQSINEVIATKIHTLQKTDIPYVKYTAEAIEGHGIISRCNAFTSEDVEFISAYEIVESQKPQNTQSLYEHYINTCIKYGIDKDIIQDFMDYQTLTDFIISNTDEHLMNFGVLRNAKTLELIDPAPIFDSGNSMFYNDDRLQPYKRSELLERPITSFYKTEDKMLTKIKERQRLVKLDLLPSPNEIKELYIEAGIPEKKADFISQNYETKLEMTNEFQHGKNFSVYLEKKEERKHIQAKKENLKPFGQKIIVMCGLPGTGKTKYVDCLLKEMEKDPRPSLINKKVIRDSKNLYTIDDYLEDATLVFNKTNVLNKCKGKDGYNNSIVVISLNDIRKEVSEQKLDIHDNNIFLIAEIRMKTALLSGADVIFDASNIYKDSRKNILDLAKSMPYKNFNMELHIIESLNLDKETKVSNERMKILEEQFRKNYPSMDEGWTNIIHIEQPIKENTFIQSSPNNDGLR